jgi:polysaccharide export outer membrane protein
MSIIALAQQPATDDGGPQPTDAASDGSEEHKQRLPTYRIEPPDVLLIDAIYLVPRGEYRIRKLDVLGILVSGTLLDMPIAGKFHVQQDGKVVLGPAYGAVSVVGLTREEAEKAVREHLLNVLVHPGVAITIEQSSAVQQIAGEHLVGPDGKVNLGIYGSVYVADMTLSDAKDAIEKHLGKDFEDPIVSVDVFSYNSKVYYVIIEGNQGAGDVVARYPIAGNETVLDALAKVKGLRGLSKSKISISRPGVDGKPDKQLDVDWHAITDGADTSKYLQILPGDRIFVRGATLTPSDSSDKKKNRTF